MASLAEQRAILAQLAQLGNADIDALFNRFVDTATSAEFFAIIAAAFPELVAQFAVAATEFATVWYAEAATDLAFAPRPAELPDLRRFEDSARWAMGAGDGGNARNNLKGVLQRGVWDAARDTTIRNAEDEPGATWARHASSSACAFCKVLATRTDVYTSKAAAQRVVGRGTEMTAAQRRDRARGLDRQTGESGRSNGRFLAGGVKARGTQKVGDKYHDHCSCVAVAVRPGHSYSPPDYVGQWTQEYIDATRATHVRGQPTDMKAVLAHMRSAAGTK